MKATDAQDVAMTDQLTWAIDVSALETSSAPAAEGSAATPNAEKQTYPIQAYFGQGNYYDQKHLTVHVEKRSYKPSSEPTYQPGNPLPAAAMRLRRWASRSLCTTTEPRATCWHRMSARRAASRITRR